MQTALTYIPSEQFKDNTSTDDSVQLSDEETLFQQTNTKAQNKYRTSVIDQLLNLCMTFELSYDTFFIMVGYLDKLINKNIPKRILGIQLLSLTLVFIGAKVNEIYPPTLQDIVNESKKSLKKSQIILAQALIVEKLDYQVMPLENIYFDLITIIQEQKLKSIELECQDILMKIIRNEYLLRHGSKTTALSIIYSLKPQIIRKIGSLNILKIKGLAKQICKAANIKA